MSRACLLGCLLLSGCHTLLDAGEYDYEPPRACDGSPLYEDPGDGSLLLSGEQSLGLPQLSPELSHPFSRACVRDSARVHACDRFLRLELTGTEPSVIGGGGLRPLLTGNVVTTLVLVVPQAPALSLLLDLSDSVAELYLDAPNADVIVTTKGPNPLDLRSVRRVKSLVVAAEGPLLHADIDPSADSAVLGAGGGITDVNDPPSPVPPNTVTNGAPGPIPLPDCG